MKKLLKTSFSAAVCAGTLFASFPGGNAESLAKELLHKNPSHFSHAHHTLDLAIVNDEKLLDSLVKRGVIPANATEAEKQQALHKYLDLKGKPTKPADADPLAGKVKAAKAKKMKKFKEYSNGLTRGKGNKYGQLRPDPVAESASPGVAKKGKILTLLVEFSDMKHNSIKPDETDNYYPDYNTEHFRAMIFGNKGEFKGPNGETLVSQKQFYEEQSGGTYTIEGNVYGWLSVPGTAAFYGADRPDGGHDNVSPGGARQLVVDAYKAALAAGVPLEEYDKEDPHDLDGDGNFWEPDGLVDHLQIIHAGMGQEAGGGSLGDNAIWSHRSARFYDPDGLGKGKPGFYDYTMMPEDGATGVFAHEYGHDLGLPDEYDTLYSGAGEPVGYWSLMSSGSWAGKIPGTEPTGFSPWAKQYFQATLGGKWTNPTVVNWEDITSEGMQFLLDQANSPLGQNHQAIRVNLPKKKTPINTPASGNYEYWGGQGDEIDTNMVVDLDLTGKKSATLTFDAWYDIEEQWDFAFVQVSVDGGQTWKSLGNEHTRSDIVPEGYPTILHSMPGFTGNSNGWQAQSFDLSAYAGQNIKLRLRYATDWGTSYSGFFVDNLKVTADGATILEDGAEQAASPFAFNGFTRMDGNKFTDHYYLLEWRNHQGVDQGLAHIKRGNSLMSYDGGLVVWYVDDSFTDNWTGVHPGDGYLGVVDAHLERDLVWNTGAKASTRYHIADAAFGLNPTSVMDIKYPTQKLHAPSQKAVSLFDDSRSFENPFLPDAGRKVPHYGLKVKVKAQAKDKSVGLIEIYR